MQKAVKVVCLAGVLALIMTVIASPSSADPPNTVTIKLINDGQGSCDIEIDDKGNRFKGVCAQGLDHKKCSVNQFTWKLNPNPCNNKPPGWTVVITNASRHPECFVLDSHPDPAVVARFESANPPPDWTQTSGPPDSSCLGDKYGTYWPYVITLYDGAGGVVVDTDPGGIIFP